MQAELACTIIFVTRHLRGLILGDHVVILAEAGRIAQQGSGTDLVAHPANDFVASFLGVDTERELHVRKWTGSSWWWTLRAGRSDGWAARPR